MCRSMTPSPDRTLGELVQLYQAACALCALPLEATVAHDARTLRRIIKPHYDDHTATRDATLARYAVKDDTGQPVVERVGATLLYQFPEDAGKQCAAELAALDAKGVMVDRLPTFRLQDLAGTKVAGDVLDWLGDLLLIDDARGQRGRPS